jgi:hypothetical protein
MSDPTNTIKIELTMQEAEFILNLISQLSISPVSKDAAQIVQLVQTLVAKFKPQ